MKEGNLKKVWEIKVLKRKGKQEEARKMMERIAKQVEPIMRNHNWRVKVLSEMFPKRKQLLGLNVGTGIEVKLRLRKPNNDMEFLPFDRVLDTMLHELCHNAHRPHNASFYKLWDQLRKECEELMAKGITGTGEGFNLPGKRLGGSSRQPSLSSPHRTSLAAAQKRQKLNFLLPAGPLRLGGDKTIMTSLSPAQAAAMAAERRLQDEIWCASSFNGADTEDEENSDVFETVSFGGDTSSSSSSGTSRKIIKTSYGDNLINSTSNVNSTSAIFHDTRLGKRCRDSCSSSSYSLSNGLPKPDIVSRSKNLSTSRLTNNHTPSNKSSESDLWTCEMCTLLNRALALVCEACETAKPKDVSLKYKLWTCKICTLENSSRLEKCSACDQWRYTRGPPIASLAPNLGT